MNKKLLFPIVAIILAIATITVGVLLIIQNMADCEVVIGQESALAGDTVSIPVTIKNNPGIWGGQIIIDYDSKNLSFLSMTGGTVFDECQVNDTGENVAILVTQSALKDSKADGEIAVLSFKVKESAKKGAKKITFNDESNFCNIDQKMIEPVLKDGKITVK